MSSVSKEEVKKVLECYMLARIELQLRKEEYDDNLAALNGSSSLVKLYDGKLKDDLSKRTGFHKMLAAGRQKEQYQMQMEVIEREIAALDDPLDRRILQAVYIERPWDKKIQEVYQELSQETGKSVKTIKNHHYGALEKINPEKLTDFNLKYYRAEEQIKRDRGRIYEKNRKMKKQNNPASMQD